MKTKRMIELLSLSTSLYLISKDEKLMGNLSDLASKGKEKLQAFLDDEDGATDGSLLSKIKHKAEQAKDELEIIIAESVEKMYAKMNITHTNRIAELEQTVHQLKKELALVEAKVLNLEIDSK